MTIPVKHPPGRRSEPPFWLDSVTFDNVPHIVNELFLLGQLPMEVEMKGRTMCEDFLYEVIHDVAGIKAVTNMRQYLESCKLRYKELSDLCQELLTAAEGEIHVKRITGHGEVRSYLLNRTNRKVSISISGTECWRTYRKPKSYGHILRFLCESIAVLQGLYEDQTVDGSQYKEAVQQIVLIATSLGKVYEDFRGGQAFEEDEYNRAYDRLRVIADPLDRDSEWWNIFQEVKEDLRAERPARYVRDIVKAIPKELTPYEYEDYHLSFKKTGCMDSHDQAIPGLYAALIEYDPLLGVADDNLIGYESHYNQVLPDGYQEVPRLAIMIKQHKLDYRLIHMASNAIQDRASYYHRRIAAVLRRLNTDCTFDQGNGMRFAAKVTNPRYVAEHRNNVYCLDISKATDTLNLEFQRACLNLLFSKEHVDNWTLIMSGWEKLTRYSKPGHHPIEQRDVCQEVGQPQGLKSSFPAFAFVHHVIMRMVMAKNGLKQVDPAQFYRVLGDDSIISWVDPEDRILDDYREACDWIGWKTNDKGYIFRCAEDLGAWAEFAHVRYLNGVVTTPIPIRLLTKSVTSESAEFALLVWYSEHVRRLSIEDLLDILVDHWSISDVKQIGLTFLHEIPDSEFSKFSMDWAGETPDPGYLQLCYLAYTWSKLNQTLLNQFVPESMLDASDSWKTHRVDAFLNSKEEERFLHLCDDPNNKYWVMLQRNEDLINALNEVFGSQSEAVGALHLSEEESLTIIKFCEMIMDLQYTGPLPVDVYKPILDETCRILGKYNHRSKVTSSRETGEVLATFDKTFRRLLRILVPDQDVVSA